MHTSNRCFIGSSRIRTHIVPTRFDSAIQFICGIYSSDYFWRKVKGFTVKTNHIPLYQTTTWDRPCLCFSYAISYKWKWAFIKFFVLSSYPRLLMLKPYQTEKNRKKLLKRNIWGLFFVKIERHKKMTTLIDHYLIEITKYKFKQLLNLYNMRNFWYSNLIANEGIEQVFNSFIKIHPSTFTQSFQYFWFPFSWITVILVMIKNTINFIFVVSVS